MSNESFESGSTSTEDIELRELSPRSDGCSDSESNSDFTIFCRTSTKQRKIDEVKDVSITFLNTSDENHHDFDIEQTSFSSLKGISPGDLPRNRSVLATKTLSLDDSSLWRTASLDILQGSLTKRFSSLDTLKEPSTRKISPLEPMKEPSTRRILSLDHNKESSTRRVLSLDPLEGPSTRRFSSLDPLKDPSTKSISSLDPLEGPSTRRVSSLDGLEGPSSRRVSCLDPLDGPSTKRVLSLDPLEGPSTRRVSSMDRLEGPSTRRVSSLDSLEGLLNKTVSFCNSAESSTSMSTSQSLDPLEGPSTRKVWFSDSCEDSLTSICIPPSLEMETNEQFNNESPIEQNGYWFRLLAWVSSFLRRYSRQIRHSNYYPLFYVALFAIPSSAGYMSSKYNSLCDGCPKLPHLVYLSGLLGMGIITLRIATILSRRYLAPALTGREFNSWMVTICFPFFLFLLVEMFTTYICEPIFSPIKPHEKFCIKVFYNYTYYLNVIVLLVILLLMLIHIPGCYDSAEVE